MKINILSIAIIVPMSIFAQNIGTPKYNAKFFPQNYEGDIIISQPAKAANGKYGQGAKVSTVNPPEATTLTASCGAASAAFPTYNDPAFFIPLSGDPVKTIEINFIIVQDGNGGSNFQDNSTDRAHLANIYGWMPIIHNLKKNPTVLQDIPQLTLLMS